MKLNKSIFNFAGTALVAMAAVIVTSASFLFLGEPEPPQK